MPHCAKYLLWFSTSHLKLSKSLQWNWMFFHKENFIIILFAEQLIRVIEQKQERKKNHKKSMNERDHKSYLRKLLVRTNIFVLRIQNKKNFIIDLVIIIFILFLLECKKKTEKRDKESLTQPRTLQGLHSQKLWGDSNPIPLHIQPPSLSFWLLIRKQKKRTKTF